MARGTLDALGEQTFTDGKVRKALQIVMHDPPRALLNLVRSAIGDENLAPQRIKESLIRISREPSSDGPSVVSLETSAGELGVVRGRRPIGAKTAGEIRRTKAGATSHDEAHHLNGKPQEAIALYRVVDRLCLTLDPSATRRRYLAKTINYDRGKRVFCSVHLLQGGLRIWLPLKYHQLPDPPPFARDVTNVGHWGRGDLELRITNRNELDQATELIRRSFEAAG
jgi:predicted transport protein